jgi:hypothetical protein
LSALLLPASQLTGLSVITKLDHLSISQSQGYQWFGRITDKIAGAYAEASTAATAAATDAVAVALTDASGQEI